jgi:hypothetical protein
MTASSDDARRSFQTYLFFLRHFDLAIRSRRDDSSEQRLLSAVVREQEPLLVNLRGRILTPELREQIRKLLFNAWNSEVVAGMNSLFDESVRFITNQWKPIQTYYALYFHLVAIHSIFEPRHRNKHEATLHFATNSICDKLPRPWNCRYDFDHDLCVGFPWPKAPQVVSGWNLANQKPSVYLVHFYRTSGKEKLAERWRERKGQKHPKQHLRAGKRIQKQDIQVGALSIWDALWRIRKWANYKEADSLLEGQKAMRQEYINEFDYTLNSLLNTSAAVLEHFLKAIVGSNEMRGYCDHYLKLIGNTSAPSLKERLELMKNL